MQNGLIKWGDTPLALLLLSPISMFSFTFLISNGVGHIIAKLPRWNRPRQNEITVRTKSMYPLCYPGARNFGILYRE